MDPQTKTTNPVTHKPHKPDLLLEDHLPPELTCRCVPMPDESTVQTVVAPAVTNATSLPLTPLIIRSTGGSPPYGSNFLCQLFCCLLFI